MNRFPALLCAIWALAHAGARAQAGPITVERVRETVTWLASDEREGRDSPSRGLEAAGAYLAERFQAAGLEQAVPKSWFHDYTLPGFRLDSRSIALTVKVTVKGDGDKQDRATVCELKPDDDVRLLRAGSVPNGADQPATVAYAGDPRVDRLLMAGAGRRPIILEVAPDDWSWQSAAGARESLSPRLLGDTPVFLVRKGLLPAVPPVADGDGKPNPGNDTRSSFAASWTVPVPAKTDLPLRNVVALLRGESKPDEYVMVSAHYDHLGVGRPVKGDSIYNGADDDASGTTAVVLIAEAMSKQRPARSVLFVCFSAEEKGLRGSAAFAAHPPVPLDRVVADVNIEMIGRPLPGREKQAWITGPGYSDFAAIARPALQRAGIELVDFDMQDPLFAQSDNWSLAMKDVVAHSVSAGSLHDDYHKPSDEVQKLDLAHMTAVIRGLCEVVRDLADREQRPAYTAAGKAVLARRRR